MVSPPISHLLALATMITSGKLSAVEALRSSPTTTTAAEQQFILKAPGETCGYIDGRVDQAYTCGDTRQTCAYYFPMSIYGNHSETTPPVSPRSFATLSGTTETVIVDTPQIRKGMLRRGFETGPTTTPAPNVNTGPEGAMACCDSNMPVCTLQPTACVDNHLHPASVLCTGNCPNDDMTLKCTAGMDSQCRLAHVATPIAYFEKPSYDGGKTRRTEKSDQGRLATLNQVVRGWYCAQLDTNTDIVSQYIEISTLGQSNGTTPDRVATETPSFDETATNWPQPTKNHDKGNYPGETPQPGPQPAPSLSNPNFPVDTPPFDAEHDETSAPSNENCDWVDENGKCCNPSEGAYYRPRRQRQIRRTHFAEFDMGAASTSTIHKLDVVTYTHSTIISSRPMTTITPVEPPIKPIVEAIYIISNAYDNRTHTIQFREATRSHTILLYTNTPERSSATAKPTQFHPIHPTSSSNGDSKAGMKAGIAIGALVFVALVAFIVWRWRSLRKAKRANLERDAQPGPTRGWGT